MNARVVLAFLQNAYSDKFAGRAWPRRSWLKALAASRSGSRLRVLEREAGPEVEFYYANTTPLAGARPDSVIPPDLGHMLRLVRRVKPWAVVGLGRQAAAAVPKVFAGRTLYLPHPAYRLLDDRVYVYAGRLLCGGAFGGGLALRPVRGGVWHWHGGKPTGVGVIFTERVVHKLEFFAYELKPGLVAPELVEFE